MERIAAEAQARFGRTLPINATGGIGALLNELGFPTEVARGLGTWEQIRRATLFSRLSGHSLRRKPQPPQTTVSMAVGGFVLAAGYPFLPHCRSLAAGRAELLAVNLSYTLEPDLLHRCDALLANLRAPSNHDPRHVLTPQQGT